MGLFAVQSVVERVAREARDTLTSQIPDALQFIDVSPPCSVEVELEPREYRVRLAQRDKDKRVKEFRRQATIRLVTMLHAAERHRPRLIVGCGQGGVIVVRASMPSVLETTCRLRAVTPLAMKTFRQAWSGVAGLISIHPEIMPQLSYMDLVESAFS